MHLLTWHLIIIIVAIDSWARVSGKKSLPFLLSSRHTHIIGMKTLWLDQRGTGLSTSISSDTLPAHLTTDEQKASYLKHFRADSIGMSSLLVPFFRVFIIVCSSSQRLRIDPKNTPRPQTQHRRPEMDDSRPELWRILRVDVFVFS